MRDFKLWSYAKTAEVAEHLEKEITPLKNPDKGLLQKMHEVVSKCLRHYEPLERVLFEKRASEWGHHCILRCSGIQIHILSEAGLVGRLWRPERVVSNLRTNQVFSGP